MGLGIDKIWQMIGNQRESNRPTHAKATVLRRDDDGTLWVKIEGGVDETPVYSTTADVKPNDVVTVKVTGGKVYIEGSTSSPSVGTTEFGDTINVVNKNLGKVDEKAEKAAEESEAALAAAKAAQEATDVARATSQHFWVNDDEPETYGGAGAHVTEQEKEDWAEAIRRRFPDLSDEKPYHNILMNSLGILLRTALNNLVSITRSAIAFFDGEGNNSENIVASFGKDGAQVGSSETANMFIDSTHVTGASSEGMKYLEMTVEGERESRNAVSQEIECVAEQSTTIKLSNAFEVGEWPPPRDTSLSVFLTYEKDGYGSSVIMDFEYGVPDNVDAEDSGETFSISYDGDSSAIVTASVNCSALFRYTSHAYTPMFVFGSGLAEEPYSVAEGQGTYSGGYASRAQGVKTKAYGYGSHAEGWKTIAAGDYSHAEGRETHTGQLGDYAHAEGCGTVASDMGAHAEGRFTEARGYGSHAEGGGSIASGPNSHAQNSETIARGHSQTAIGRFNIEDTEDKYALIIGNGTADNARSNAFTVDWEGNIDFSGKIPVSKLSWAGTTDNLVATATDNDQEWSIDLVPNGHTGTYWQVWTAAKSTMLRCDVDSGRVTMPYEVYSNSRFNVKMGSIQRGVKPSAIAYGNYEVKDKDEKRLSITEFCCNTDGTNELRLYVLGNTTSGDHYSGIIIRKAFGNTATANMVYDANSGWLEVPATVRVANLTQYKGDSIEFYPPTNNSGYGGIIDFHFKQSLEDYTSRIWETASGRIQVLGSGNFEKRGSGSGNGIWTIATNMTRDEQRSTQQDAPAFVIGDTSYGIMGRMCVRHESGTNKIHWNMLEINRVVNGTSIWNGLFIGIDKNGSLLYYVSNAANFRSAIGAAASSDRRLKSDISMLGDDAVAFIDALEPCVYTINGERQVGLIAQDVYEADTWGTRMAFETEEGLDGLDDWEKMEDGSPTWKLDYIRIIPPLVATVKSQARRIEELEDKVSRLEKLVESIVES